MHLDLLKTSDLAAADLDEARYRRERSSGTLHRLRRGRYLSSDTWAALDARTRHRAAAASAGATPSRPPA
ncbi:hypothetical protein [Frondihabitans peucedani]|uniref:Uncharacterized protein n=1 Tax=Frondihabitans peucedani TaxID=598626 RepID=A0ABP8DWX7_9MICO